MFAGLGALGGGVVIFGFMLGGRIRTRVGRAFVLALFFSLNTGGLFCFPEEYVTVDPNPDPIREETCDQHKGNEQQCRTMTNLAREVTYYWKVVASDGRGGIAESETRLFVTEYNDYDR